MYARGRKDVQADVVGGAVGKATQTQAALAGTVQIPLMGSGKGHTALYVCLWAWAGAACTSDLVICALDGLVVSRRASLRGLRGLCTRTQAD
jgi:hypothetical protein